MNVVLTCTLVLFILIVASVLFSLQRHAYDKTIDQLIQKNRHLKKKVKTLEEDDLFDDRSASDSEYVAKVMKERDELEATVETLQKKIEIDTVYIKEFRKIYTDIKNEGTRRYALRVFDYYPQDLDLFDVCNYRESNGSNHYAKVIDLNAEVLYDMISMSTSATRQKIKDLLKNGGTDGCGGGGSSAPIRDRTPLTKIEKGGDDR